MVISSTPILCRERAANTSRFFVGMHDGYGFYLLHRRFDFLLVNDV